MSEPSPRYGRTVSTNPDCHVTYSIGPEGPRVLLTASGKETLLSVGHALELSACLMEAAVEVEVRAKAAAAVPFADLSAALAGASHTPYSP